MNAKSPPIGLESPLSAVAIPLSLSPNHLLQMMFWALYMIGPAIELMKAPVTIDQNSFPSKVDSYRIQHPINNNNDPSLNIKEAGSTV